MPLGMGIALVFPGYPRFPMEEDPAIAARLRAAGCVFAEEEARMLAAAARTRDDLEAMARLREKGVPLEHVIGWAEFCGLRIFVDAGVFVPRRRSEFLVETAVSLAPGASPVIVDLCCGTGALGVAVAAWLAAGSRGPGPRDTGSRGAGSRDTAELHAADIDPAAVACARRNVEPAGGRVYRGDLFAPLPGTLRGRVAILICNAPYVPTGDIGLLPPEARDHEPRTALDGGADGLAVLRRAAAEAPGWLAPGGVLLVETSGPQAPPMTRAMAAAGLTARVYSCEEYESTVVTGSLP
jgi:release factor glutamine methyltransferase